MDRINTVLAARLLGLTQQRVRQMLASGELDGQRIGRDWVIEMERVQRLIALRDTQTAIRGLGGGKNG